MLGGSEEEGHGSAGGSRARPDDLEAGQADSGSEGRGEFCFVIVSVIHGCCQCLTTAVKK